MEYIEKSDTVERVYEVYYDEVKLKKLLDDIVRNGSYKIDGRFKLSSETFIKNNKVIRGGFLPNGDPMYEKIRCVDRSDDRDMYGDWIHYVEGVEVTSPKLAYIIEKIIYKDEGINEFLEYDQDSELIPIDEKIYAAKIELDNIEDSKLDEILMALNKLKKLYENKKDGKYFDVDLLKKYYTEATYLIGLKLISEKTVKNGSKMLLNNYKNSIMK